MFDLICLSITIKKLITFFIFKANPKRGMIFYIVSLLHLNFQKVVLNELRNPVLPFSLILRTVTNAHLRIRTRCSKWGERALGLVRELRFCVMCYTGGRGGGDHFSFITGG